MAKGSKKTKIKVNVSRVIKLGAIAVFTLFAAILIYVSVFIWNTLSVIGSPGTQAYETKVQGINEGALSRVEQENQRRVNEPLPNEEYPRNPFLPVGLQVPEPPAPEPPPEPPELTPATATEPDVPTPPAPDALPNPTDDIAS